MLEYLAANKNYGSIALPLTFGYFKVIVVLNQQNVVTVFLGSGPAQLFIWIVKELDYSIVYI